MEYSPTTYVVPQLFSCTFLPLARLAEPSLPEFCLWSPAWWTAGGTPAPSPWGAPRLSPPASWDGG